jgi:GH24 family phage-related lysozyme (muramidase)
MIPDFKSLIDRICENEGFRSEVYKCSEGVDTFGHGLTYITEEESKHIVATRVPARHLKLLDKLDWYKDLPPKVKEVVIEMTYQLGTSGMLCFKKMIANMKDKNWKGAAEEMKDSLWYRQTPGRCERMATIVREHG